MTIGARCGIKCLFYPAGRLYACLCFLSAYLGKSHVKHANGFRRAFAER